MNETPKTKITGRAYVLIGLSTAFLLAMPVLIFLGIGLFLDGIFKTSPLITLFTTIIGSIGGIMNVMKIVKVVQNPEFRKRVAKEQSHIEQNKKLQS